MARKQPPLLRRAGLTGRVYVITRYTEKNGIVTAQEKFDVTEDFNLLVTAEAMASDIRSERTEGQ